MELIKMEKCYQLNILLDERLELIEEVEYWVGSEEEEEKIHSEINSLTQKIAKLQNRMELIK